MDPVAGKSKHKTQEGVPSTTRHLVVEALTPGLFSVQLIQGHPLEGFGLVGKSQGEKRYSPVMPAFLSPGEEATAVPQSLSSVAFIFSPAPYQTLAALRAGLTSIERHRVYFTLGLASVVIVNASWNDAQLVVQEQVPGAALEYWQITDGKLSLDAMKFLLPSSWGAEESGLPLPKGAEPDIAVYVEQISASLTSLWLFYQRYMPEERTTLRAISEMVNVLIQEYSGLRDPSASTPHTLSKQKSANAIISALVEISAALSYVVTQGTSGSLPILNSRSPFPHHSLLGVGTAVRALTKYTRYLEAAFVTRSAGQVIKKQYPHLQHKVPFNIPRYSSGSDYKWPEPSNFDGEFFDRGGDFEQSDDIPLLAYFSLRHGFMESKFSVTAASEALTCETLPQWTLMTLSHEIMHSRVRTIFQALFGNSWDQADGPLLNPEHFRCFTNWVSSPDGAVTRVDEGIRNAILNFCYVVDQFHIAKSTTPQRAATEQVVGECYRRRKQLAVEIVVHFHDFYFAYACQPKLYMMSVWASWIKVAAPFTRTQEYLVRSLATVACGTALTANAAYDHAVDVLIESLDALESADVSSPLFSELRRLVGPGPDADDTRALFRPCYYLMDQTRLFFASQRIAKRIDRIESDPFSEGTTEAQHYSGNVYVYGDARGESLSPIRYSVASLCRTLAGELPMDDTQWLTSWNYMVIASLEVKS